MKGDAREVARYVKNIIALYLDAPDITRQAGREWYAEESARCSDFAVRHGLALRQVAGAVAAISPGLRWDTTFAHLAALLKDPKARVPTYSRLFVERANSILRGETPDHILGGPKVIAFYRLLYSAGGTDDVVIDGHAWNICRNECITFRTRPGYTPPARVEVTLRRYRLAAAAYREAAEVLGERPHAVQAGAWIHWRNLFKRGSI